MMKAADGRGAPATLRTRTTLRWEGNARLDWRLHETTTFGTSLTLHDRAGRATQVTGRAELRAFF